MTILRMNRQRPWTIRLLAGTAIAFVAVISAAGAADAHAALVSSTPAPGSVLVDSPKTIELKFSEPVEMPQQAIRVFDANRNEIDVPTARHGASNDTVTTTLPALEEGGYVISWRVVSADGHPISAAYTFAVGQGSVGADVADAVARLKPHGASRTSGVLYGVARAIAYAALATVIGAAFMTMLLWPAAFDHRATHRLLLGSGASATIASVFVYGFQGVNTRGGNVGDLMSWSTWNDVASTHTGRWLAIRVVLLAATTALIALVIRSRGAVRQRAVTAMLAATALVAGCVAITGHAATGRHTTIGVLADIVHVMAFSLWVGGLTTLLLCVLPLAEPGAARATTTRFSQLAFGCVIALAATGTLLAWRQGVELGHPIATPYGRILAIKIAVVVALVAMGGLSRRVLQENLQRGLADDRQWRSRIRRTIAAEVLLAIVVFSVTSMLVNAAPPRSANSGPLEIRSSVAGLTADTVIDPAKVGPTELHIYLSNTTTLQPKIEELTLTLSQLTLGGAPITVKMFRAGPAHFQSDAMVFPFAGDWTLTIGVRIDAFTRDTVEATITIV